MSSINSEQITHIARLARLKPSESQANRFARQISRILDLVEQMNQVETDSIKPMAHPQDAVLRLREDGVTSTNRRDDYQALAPLAKEGLYLVPQVIQSP